MSVEMPAPSSRTEMGRIASTAASSTLHSETGTQSDEAADLPLNDGDRGRPGSVELLPSQEGGGRPNRLQRMARFVSQHRQELVLMVHGLNQLQLRRAGLDGKRYSGAMAIEEMQAELASLVAAGVNVTQPAGNGGKLTWFAADGTNRLLRRASPGCTSTPCVSGRSGSRRWMLREDRRRSTVSSTRETGMQDSIGNEVTTGSTAASRLIDEAIDLHARGWPGALQAAEWATREDPELAIAHALQGLIHGMWGRRAAADAAMSHAIASAPRSSRRERSLVELLDHAVRGRPHAALAWLLLHLRDFPSDLLAVTTAVGAYWTLAFSGRADHDQLRLDLLDDLEGHFPPDYPWLLAYRGWARIEAGAVEEGLAMASRAIERCPENAHNAHIIGHGLYEAGRPQQYLEFASVWLRGYPADALMWGHLQWHAALAELMLDRHDEAVERCMGSILPYLSRGTPFMGLADVPSLLWRLALHGVRDLPWGAALEHARKYFPDGSNAFGEFHIAMLAAAHRDMRDLEACCERLDRLAKNGSLGASAAASWARALQSLIDGPLTASAGHFGACEANAVRLGGSHAQRSVISLTRQASRIPRA
jgi:tetratricopeptide (TPR) repeat protein